MSRIDLKRFVNIDIQQHISPTVIGTRDTVVLFTGENANIGNKLITGIVNNEIILDDGSKVAGSTIPNTFEYLKVFYNNNGGKVKLVENTQYSTLTKEVIKALDNKYICIAYAAEESSQEEVYEKLKTIAEDLSNDNTVYGINEKLILARTMDNSDDEEVKNFVVKYSSIQGAEMTIAAYLSKINVYGINTIYDYAFTQEVITPETISDTNFGLVIENNMNIDVNLANTIRNCGGNCKDGLDITNNFVRIILHQTLTDKLLNLLLQKIKGNTALGKIYTVISQELDNYLTNGYLSTDKIWKDDKLVINRNGVDYTIIDKGTPLTNGYIIQILPMKALSAEEQRTHSTPPIYIIISDQYGIRQITINGEVI